MLASGPIPKGQDKSSRFGCQGRHKNALWSRRKRRPGVRRVLSLRAGSRSEDFLRELGRGSGRSDVGAVIVTGNYPSDWATQDLASSLKAKSSCC